MFKVQESRQLQWSVSIGGSKNAALPLLAAALLIKWKIHLTNVPDILDIHDFIHFYESLWAEVSFKNHELFLDTANLDVSGMDTSKIARTRAWIYFIAWLLHRFWNASIPFPSWDKIWKRPIDEHINGYKDMWYTFFERDDMLHFEGPWFDTDVTITAYFAVTATANLIMWWVGRKWITTIELAAFEPHIFNLVDMLRQAGVVIDIRYDHTIIIHWGTTLASEISQEIIPDYLQSGTFIILWALASEKYIDIHRARISDLASFLYKIHETGVKTQDMWNDTLRVYRAHKLKAVNIQTNIFPWFPTDLMPLFSVLMTQCEWTSRIHEILYEGRLNWLVEYERLWASPRIINLHEAKITWPTALVWNTVNSWDLRSWAAMVLAGLISSWETKIDNIYWINRGYDDFIWKLKQLWANIEELTTNT